MGSMRALGLVCDLWDLCIPCRSHARPMGFVLALSGSMRALLDPFAHVYVDMCVAMLDLFEHFGTHASLIRLLSCT
jgi:hypothetical protein